VAWPRAAAPQSPAKGQHRSVRAARAGADPAGSLTTRLWQRAGLHSGSATSAANGDAATGQCSLPGLSVGPGYRSARRTSAAQTAPLPGIAHPASTRNALSVGTGSGTSVPALAPVALIAVIAPSLGWRMRVHIGLSCATRVDPVPAHPG
jgi:hypothetical protein